MPTDKVEIESMLLLI